MTSTRSSDTTTVYFDNCLVAAVVKGDHPDQISAISTLLRAHAHGDITLVASTEVLREIQRLPSQYQGPHLDVWRGLQKLPASRVTWVDEHAPTPSVGTDPLYVRLQAILRDHDDRLHVFHAEKQSVDYFATVDYRTILNKRPALTSVVSMRFGTPNEVVGAIGITPSA